jgi:hypothetical protein
MMGAARSGDQNLGPGKVLRLIATAGGPLLPAILLTLASAALPADAAQPVRLSQSVTAAAKPQPSWQVLVTQNFRILSYDTRPAGAEVGRACEGLRLKLAQKWTGDSPLPNWSPKCDVVLHPNDASYLKEVGAGAVSTVASSLVDQQRGRIRLRRIDVRSVDSDWQSAALPHEMTHVVLADRFVGQTIPRWIDEGVAILADPTEKQLRHRADLVGAISNRSAFRVVELLTLDDYPAADRWGIFYGQSASIVEFLVAQRSAAEFVRFIQLSSDQGYDASLREVYGFSGVAELERRWTASEHNSPKRAMVKQVPVKQGPLKHVPGGQAVSAGPGNAGSAKQVIVQTGINKAQAVTRPKSGQARAAQTEG